MKKTVTLSSLVKAKKDLEFYIQVGQMKRLKTLFLPNFNLSELNSDIEAKDDQLLIIKEAIAKANVETKDNNGHSVNYWVYLLSKYNRAKADNQLLLRKLDTSDFLKEIERTKSSLLKEISDLNEQIDKETDKKVKADLSSRKTKLKRSLSKLSSKNNSNTDTLRKEIETDIMKNDVAINEIKPRLTELNTTLVEVEIADEFKLIG